MTKSVNAILAGAFAAGILVTPAAVAQTDDRAKSTGGEQHNKEKNEMDSVRKNQTTTPSGGATAGAGEGRKSMDDDTTGSTSDSTPKNKAPLGPTDTQD